MSRLAIRTFVHSVIKRCEHVQNDDYGIVYAIRTFGNF